MDLCGRRTDTSGLVCIVHEGNELRHGRRYLIGSSSKDKEVRDPLKAPDAPSDRGLDTHCKMELSNLPLEVSELIFSNVVWDGFRPELVESLTSATQCIDQLCERNRQLRELRTTARFVDCIVNRLAWKYVHITSQARAKEFIEGAHAYHMQGTVVRHLFLGDQAGRYQPARAPAFTWVSEESGKEWIEDGTFGKLLAAMPNLISLHVHLPGIHSQILSGSIIQREVASPYSLETIRCLSLYDDVNNTPSYEAVQSLISARESLSAFPSLRYLVISESEGFSNLDKLIGWSSSRVALPYAPQLKRITLEIWCPMASDLHLYNLAIYMPWTNLAILRRVPCRMSLAGTVFIGNSNRRCWCDHHKVRPDVDVPRIRVQVSFRRP